MDLGVCDSKEDDQARAGGGGQGSGGLLLTVTEFQYGKMEKFWRWMAGMAAQQYLKSPNCTLKPGFDGKFCYACFTTIKE